MSIYDRLDWIAKRVEPAKDAQQPIVDPHHHLWDRAGSTYLASELHADTAGSHNVTHTVFVECSAEYDTEASAELAPVGETRFVAEQAASLEQLDGPTIGAIVGHADLTLGERVGEVLAAHDEAGGGLFRGIRHGTNWSAAPAVKIGHHKPAQYLLADDRFRAGVETLASMGFSFDAWLYFDQMTELAALARAIPNCTIILDHLGGPLGIGPHASGREEMLGVWRAGLAETATCDNIFLKVGGIGMEHYFGTAWADLVKPPGSEEVADHWRDMVHYAIDTFGPSRCMFESNFPVDRQTLPYSVLWNAFQILAADYSPQEQASLFSTTARTAYGF